ncbi:MAG: hypothetical protein Kow0090_06670 [Myxococcota bacterium]
MAETTKRVLGDDPFETKKAWKKPPKDVSSRVTADKGSSAKKPAAKRAVKGRKTSAEPGKPKRAAKTAKRVTATVTPPPIPPLPPKKVVEEEIKEYFRDIASQSIEILNDEIKRFDEFGYDAELESKLEPVIELLKDAYFRIEIKGLDNIPEKGNALIVSNHAGTIPLDGLMLRAAIRMEHPARRKLRFLLDDNIYYLPFIGRLMNRLGAVRACQENGQRLLEEGELVAVFPEGIQGSGKLFRDRYRLQRFGRGGFVKLALRTGSNILPVAIVGSEETYPLLAKIPSLGKPLGLAYIPITPTFPILGPLGLLPLPSRWLVKIGEPINLSVYGSEAENDPLIVNTIAEGVRDNIQEMIDELYAERKSPFF